MTPEPGTVSAGTMRPEDLIPLFLGVLDEHAPEKAEELRGLYPVTIRLITLEEQGTPVTEHETERGMLLDDLFDALNGIAPPDHYFGAHYGDGADYGFWPGD